MKKYVLTIALVLSGLVVSSLAVSGDAPGVRSRPDPVQGGVLFNQGDEARGIVACSSCHGTNGNSMIPENPKLAGQHADYILKQLLNFATKDGAKGPERNNAVMGAQVVNLTIEDKRNIAAFLGKQKLEQPAVARNKDSIALGQRIYRAGIAAKGVPACAACHGPAGTGIPSQYPHVSGQFSEYVTTQLNTFRSGERANNVPMMQIAANLSDAEIKAVSDYIAGLR